MKYLKCACCGARCPGKQWWNRDTGFGLCVDCIPVVSKGSDPEEVRLSYGVRGVHYDPGYQPPSENSRDTPK